jgi:hypothetical protein
MARSWQSWDPNRDSQSRAMTVTTSKEWMGSTWGVASHSGFSPPTNTWEALSPAELTVAEQRNPSWGSMHITAHPRSRICIRGNTGKWTDCCPHTLKSRAHTFAGITQNPIAFGCYPLWVCLQSSELQWVSEVLKKEGSDFWCPILLL